LQRFAISLISNPLKVYQIIFTSGTFTRFFEERKVYLCWDFVFVNPIINTLSLEVRQVVCIIWSKGSGKFLLFLNDEEVFYSISFDDPISHSWTKDNHDFVVVCYSSPVIAAKNGKHQNNLFIDGESVFDLPLCRDRQVKRKKNYEYSFSTSNFCFGVSGSFTFGVPNIEHCDYLSILQKVPTVFLPRSSSFLTVARNDLLFAKSVFDDGSLKPFSAKNTVAEGDTLSNYEDLKCKWKKLKSKGENFSTCDEEVKTALIYDNIAAIYKAGLIFDRLDIKRSGKLPHSLFEIFLQELDCTLSGDEVSDHLGLADRDLAGFLDRSQFLHWYFTCILKKINFKLIPCTWDQILSKPSFSDVEDETHFDQFSANSESSISRSINTHFSGASSSNMQSSENTSTGRKRSFRKCSACNLSQGHSALPGSHVQSNAGVGTHGVKKGDRSFIKSPNKFHRNGLKSPCSPSSWSSRSSLTVSSMATPSSSRERARHSRTFMQQRKSPLLQPSQEGSFCRVIEKVGSSGLQYTQRDNKICSATGKITNLKTSEPKCSPRKYPPVSKKDSQSSSKDKSSLSRVYILSPPRCNRSQISPFTKKR